jgi:hypothetical protein
MECGLPKEKIKRLIVAVLIMIIPVLEFKPEILYRIA